ncbi:MAG: hypothetical protein M1821_008574 [Bathelium mastoideum]|nr:MAG: hypothetical protein M1821_008574 [Bathelium mastoideum]
MAQLLRVDMRDSWDWKTNISQVSIPKSLNPDTGTYPPSYARGALFQGPADGTKIYSFGGTTFLANTSFPGWTGQDVDQYSLWSYDISDQTWQQYDVSASVPRRPNRPASSEAADLGLAFYLNGQIDQGSSLTTEHMGNATEDLQGLIILNTNDQTARNISTSSLGSPRVAGGLQYIEGIGSNGVLIALGGMENNGGGDASNSTGGSVVYGPGESSRWGHTCHIVGDRQMLTVGGSHDNSTYNIETTASTTDTDSLSCDWEYKGVAIYDMTELIWGSVFDAYAAPYQVPSPIISVIGGSGTGNASVTQPEKGFADPAVATMFANRDSPNATKSTQPSVPSSSSSIPNASPGRHHAGIVAGSVVGGVVALGLIILGVISLLRRRTKIQQAPQSQVTQIAELGAEDDDTRSSPTGQGQWSRKVYGEGRHEIDGEGRHEMDGEGRHEMFDPSTAGREFPNNDRHAELGPAEIL